jgi:Putative peptidoglycan binding domain
VNYTLLKQGDHLPMVGVLQHLLNRTGESVAVDGIFGSGTFTAVRSFQHKRGLRSDGIVGERTWERLTSGLTLPIVDSIDVYDPTFYKQDATYIRRAGGNPFLIGGACNGVEQMVDMITGTARDVFLLRFHGHGEPGVGGVSDGHEDGIPERSDISVDKEIMKTIGRLRPIFGRYGCVEFIQCQTGRGPKGRHLLSSMAKLLGVPITAAVHDQPFGKAWAFRLDGPTVTLFPTGYDLRSWSKSRPNFPGMTVR